MPKLTVMWFVVFILTLSVVGCAFVPQRDPLPAALASFAKPLGEPNFRMWGDEVAPQVKKWLATGTKFNAEKYPQLVGKPHNYLAISGGGANGAFGAGLLVGWSARGDRPDFTVVTGISIGALMAPFIFLGPDYDEVLRELFTTITTEDILTNRNYFSRFFSDSAMSSEPLAALLEQHIDEPLMEAIAAESEKGRSLYIGTTQLDAGRPVIWDIGNIARSGHPGALNLIRRVLLASASIPALFPPVLLEVEADGRSYDELHVDGGVTAQVFLYPAGIEWARVLERFDVPGTPRIYIIRNSRLKPSWVQTRNKAVPIAGRSLASLTRTQGIGDLYRIFLLAKRDGLDFNLAYIPDDFNEPQKEIFDQEYMQGLFDLGYRMAKDGYPWSKSPPEIEGMIDEDVQVVDAMGGSKKVLKQAKASNAKRSLEGWQWTLYLTTQLLQMDNNNAEAKTLRAEAARALGQRTTSANARGFYISEALLHEGKLRFGEYTISDYKQLSQALGAVTAEKLAASPLNDNVQYLRFMVDPRLAEGKRARFNVNFGDEKVSYAIALRNGIVAITDQANKGPTIKLSKDAWSKLILGEKRFAGLHESLKPFDEAVGRNKNLDVSYNFSNTSS